MTMVNPYNYKKPTGAINTVAAMQPNTARSTNQRKTSANKSNSYLEQEVMTAKPEKLTLMLYDGMIRFINQAKVFNDQKKIEKSSRANMRAQAIINELRATLNLDYEVSEGLDALYVFMNDQLLEANISKKNENLDTVLELVTELRDTWKEAMNL